MYAAVDDELRQRLHRRSRLLGWKRNDLINHLLEHGMDRVEGKPEAPPPELLMPAPPPEGDPQRVLPEVVPVDDAVHQQCGWCGQVDVHHCPERARLVREGHIK